MEGAAAGNEVELMSRSLQVEHKVFYFDLKENPRGRYLKISEKTSGSRSTIIVPVSGIRIFVDLFKYYADGDGSNKELESSEVQLDTKVFYFDIGENHRGRFLKVSEVTRNRSTIIIPAGNEAAEGWAAFRGILSDMNEAQHVSPADHSSVGLQESSPACEPVVVGGGRGVGSMFLKENSEMMSGYQSSVRGDGCLVGVSSSAADIDAGVVFSKVLKTDKKKIYFDLGNNARGQYLRISEVTGTDRSAIILPISALEEFHDIVGHFVETAVMRRSRHDDILPGGGGSARASRPDIGGPLPPAL